MTMPPQYPQYPPQQSLPPLQPRPVIVPPANPETMRRRIMRQAVGRPAGMVLAYYVVAQVAGAVAMLVMLLPYLGRLVGHMAGAQSAQSGQWDQAGLQDVDSVVDGVTQQALQLAGWTNLIGFGTGMLLILALNRSMVFRREFWSGGAAYPCPCPYRMTSGAPHSASGRPLAAHMRVGWFLDFIVLMVTAQAAFVLLQLVMSAFGADVTSQSMEYINQSTITWEMWLYVGLIGPVFEEIVFRGVLLRALAPYGRNFAILTSAVMFGLYHGDFTQGLFAFVIGLLLGFVAMEYSLLWSVALHVFNNAVIGGALDQLASYYGDAGEGVYAVVLLAVGIVGGLIVLVRHGREIRAYARAHRSPRGTYWGWTSARFLVYVVFTGLLVLFSLIAIIPS